MTQQLAYSGHPRRVPTSWNELSPVEKRVMACIWASDFGLKSSEIARRIQTSRQSTNYRVRLLVKFGWLMEVDGLYYEKIERPSGIEI